jgi:hypothetical protein
VAWKIPNWRHIQILIGVSSLPFAICIWLWVNWCPDFYWSSFHF